MDFQFRFAKLLQLRRRQRDDVGAEVGKAHSAIHRVDERIESIQLERQRLRDESQQQRLGAVSIDGLLGQGRYDLQLQAQIQALNQTRGELEQELQRRRAALIAAEAEVKRFEKLQQKDFAVFQSMMNRRQQAEIDDVVSCRYIINRQR